MTNQFQWNGDYRWSGQDEIQKFTDKCACRDAQRIEWFMRYCVLRHCPSRISHKIEAHLKMGGELKEIVIWFEKSGYHQRVHPDGKLEFAQYQPDGSVKVLETLPEP